MACLTDPKKKRIYDATGDEDRAEGVNQGGGGGGGGPNFAHDFEFNADDFFQ